MANPPLRPLLPGARPQRAPGTGSLGTTLLASGAGVAAVLFALTFTVLTALAAPASEVPGEALVAAGRPDPVEGVPASGRGPAPGATPVRLRLPEIGVEAGIGGLGLTPDGQVAVPEDPMAVGWYRGGPRPGDPGPALLVGHVDSRNAPGVFFRLRQLSPGATATVTYDDGSKWSFRVYDRAQYPKEEFPTDLVYGDTAGPELRLVTCGGTFDSSLRSYRDNVILWAELVGGGGGAGR